MTSRKAYAVVTALIGLTQVIFNGAWVGRPAAPFDSPAWLVMFELAWTFVSFIALLRWKSAGPESWRETPISRADDDESARIGASASAPVVTRFRDPRNGTSERPATVRIVTRWALPLAGSYVIYGGAAVILTQFLANEAGTVTEAMVPEWWKIVSVAAGLWFVAGSVLLLRRPLDVTVR